MLLLREYSSAEKRLHFALQKGEKALYRGYGGLGRTNLGQGKYSSARKFFKKALSLYPEDVVSLCGLGYVDLGESKMEVAHKLFRKALTVEPDHSEWISVFLELRRHTAIRTASNTSSRARVGFVDQPTMPARVEIHHHGQIKPAFPGPHVGDVGDPGNIWS